MYYSSKFFLKYKQNSDVLVLSSKFLLKCNLKLNSEVLLLTFVPYKLQQNF